MRNVVYLIALSLLINVNTFGQIKSDKKYVIDSLYQLCLDSAKNQNVFGMSSCSCKARDAWEKEMNNYLKFLGGILTSEENEILKNNQKTWLTYRNSELLLSGKVYAKLPEIKSSPGNFHRQYEIIRQRALDLKFYYEALKGNTK
jgi:hypothetical protein